MTRVLLDACVLFPSILREVLIGTAELGYITPLWSARILEEWQRAASRRSGAAGAVAHTEILLLKARWPKAMVAVSDVLGNDFYLPDRGDVHVLASAIEGRADELVTANLRDFPSRILARYSIIRRDPDGLLLEIAQSNQTEMATLVEDTLIKASEMAGMPIKRRASLRKVGLPRLGKYLYPKPIL